MEDKYLSRLRASVRSSRRLAMAVIALCVGGYIAYFGIYLQTPLGDSASWGQFGDYLGGILNPIIALLAFWWLTQSISLQAQEMRDTRIALQAAATAQTGQEKLAARAARINALASILACFNTDIGILQTELTTVRSRLVSERLPGSNVHMTRHGEVLYGDGRIREELERLVVELNGLFDKRAEAIRRLEREIDEGAEFRINSGE